MAKNNQLINLKFYENQLDIIQPYHFINKENGTQRG